ncbi:MAG: hypothetical protein NTX45_30120 [Proteobacteria bacterium]|nr:hypothetical protein [Pseudomonadota bacterium]
MKSRKLTLVWCAFFPAGNGPLAAATAWHGDRWIWGLCSRCIAYVPMGAEMVVRKTFKKKRLTRHAGN